MHEVRFLSSGLPGEGRCNLMNLVSLTIDGRPVQIAAGSTVLQAARQIGLDIPTLCFLEKCTPATSCLVCLVKVQSAGAARMVPSCATLVQPGMVIESETTEVHAARRTALELLLSDHVGDCLSPCHRICPLHLNIPVMLRQVEHGQLAEAARTVRSALPLPAVLGRLCHHPCENGCRRSVWDQPAAIRDLERHVADTDLRQGSDELPHRKMATRKSVVVVGSGPAGLSAAFTLLQQGHSCTVVDRQSEAGGALRTKVDAQLLPREILDAELAQLRRWGLNLKLGVEFGTVVTLDGLQRGFDAVLLTVGELSPGEGTNFGVTLAGNGIKADPLTYQASVANASNVFAAGSAVKRVAQLVRAMAEGRAAAEQIDRYLSGQEFQSKEKTFSSIMGRVEKVEVELFLKHAGAGPRANLFCATCGPGSGALAQQEAGRCLHCDCRAVGNCALQRYGELYGAEPSRFREQRRVFEQELQDGHVIFEPGKCILCGICVQLAERAREPLGLTFVGRGFDVRVTAPFGRSIAEGLQKVAAECVEHCPTGALVLRDAPTVSPASAGCKAKSFPNDP